MSIRAVCPACGREHNLADALQGKRIKCKECTLPFLVDDGHGASSESKPDRELEQPTRRDAIRPAVRPARNRDDADIDERRHRDRRVDDDEPRPRRRSGTDRQPASNTGLIIGLSVGGGVLALVLVVFVVFSIVSRDADKAPPVAVAPNPPPVLPPPNPPNIDPGVVNPPAVNPPVVNPPIVNPPVFNPPAKKPPRVRPKKNPPINPADNEPPAAAVPWRVQADPGPNVNQAPTPPQASHPLAPGFSEVYFPSTPSPFAAVKQGAFQKEALEVLNLFTFQQVGVIPGRMQLHDVVLSSDGKLLAGKAFKVGRAVIEVWSVAEARAIGSFDPGVVLMRGFDFADAGQIVVLSSKGLNSQIDVWNGATGQKLRSIANTGHLDDRDWALSSGRKYLAMHHKGRIRIHHLSSGELHGELSLPAGKGFGSFNQLKGLAFSPDGQELACLREQVSRGSQIVSWKLDSGAIAVKHDSDQAISGLAGIPFYRWNAVQWVPDRSGWFMFGQVWIDYASGAPVYTMPRVKSNPGDRPVRLVGKDHVAEVAGDIQKRALTLQALPREEIAAAVQAARTGAGQAATELPTAKTPDLASAKMLPAPSGAVTWKVKPTAAPAPKAVLASQPIALKAKPQDVLGILFSGSEAGQAAMLHTYAANPLSAKRQVRVERLDLVQNKSIGTVDLFIADLPRKPKIGLPVPVGGQNGDLLRADLSPDGTRVLVKKLAEPRRLDLWSLVDGKHLAGWNPGAGDVSWFAFLDAGRVLTLSDSKLILWKVPECQAVYVAEGYRGDIELSPDRKWLVAHSGTALEILDAAMGERAGQLAAAGGPTSLLKAAGFKRDGSELAAVIHDVAGRPHLARWKLDDGAWLGNYPVNQAAGPVLWAGAHLLLRGNILYDWKIKSELVQYYLGPANGRLAPASPDGRLWFAAELGPDKMSILTARGPDDAKTRDMLDQAAGGKLEPLIRPGAAIQITVNVNPRVQAQVQTSLTRHLESAGYKIGPGELTLNVSVQERPTGKLLEYELTQLGKGFSRKVVKIQEREAICQAVVTDNRGAQVYKIDGIAFRTPSSMRFVGDNYQTELDQAVSNSATSWASSVSLPTNLYRVNGQPTHLPVMIPLGR